MYGLASTSTSNQFFCLSGLLLFFYLGRCFFECRLFPLRKTQPSTPCRSSRHSLYSCSILCHSTKGPMHRRRAHLAIEGPNTSNLSADTASRNPAPIIDGRFHPPKSTKRPKSQVQSFHPQTNCSIESKVETKAKGCNGTAMAMIMTML